jgi:hypothetical protein
MERYDFEALDWLLKESFQLEDGRIYLKGWTQKPCPFNLS